MNRGGSVEDRAHAAVGCQCQAPFRTTVGFLLKVDDSRSEVGVVVVVAIPAIDRIHLVEELEAGSVLPLVVDEGRIHVARDLQHLQARRIARVFHGFGLHGDAVELAGLLGRHAPLGRSRSGTRLCLLAFEFSHACLQGLDFLQQVSRALRCCARSQRGSQCKQCSLSDGVHGLGSHCGLLL